MEFNQLIKSINETSDYFQKEVLHQVNVALTLRNWVIGFYLYEYEQNGQDRAAYGARLYKEVALKMKKHRGFSKSNLHSFVAFYRTYPQIFSTVSRRFKEQIWLVPIVQSLTGQLVHKKQTPVEPTDAERNLVKTT